MPEKLFEMGGFTALKAYDEINHNANRSAVFKLLSLQGKTKSWRIQIPPGLKKVFVKYRFRNGLVWTVGLAVKKKKLRIFKVLQCLAPKATCIDTQVNKDFLL